jgi:hypothetical protein
MLSLSDTIQKVIYWDSEIWYWDGLGSYWKYCCQFLCSPKLHSSDTMQYNSILFIWYQLWPLIIKPLNVNMYVNMSHCSKIVGTVPMKTRGVPRWSLTPVSSWSFNLAGSDQCLFISISVCWKVTVQIVSVQCQVIRVLDCFQLPDVTAGVVIISWGSVGLFDDWVAGRIRLHMALNRHMDKSWQSPCGKQ